MFCLDDHYYLLHAFDRLGRHLYGDKWSGYEYRAKPLRAPEEIERKRAEINARIAELDARQNAIADEIRKTVKAARIDELNAEKREVVDRRSRCHEELHTVFTLDDGYRDNFHRYERRLAVEQVLSDALERGTLTAFYGENYRIDWPSWQHSGEFKLYLDLSMAKAPRNQSAYRRAAVLFRRRDFDAWLKTVEPIEPSELAKMPLKDQCRAFVRHHVQTAGNRVWRKPELRELAQQHIPGLPSRTFDAVWEELAPAHWKRAGRKPKIA